MAASKFTPEIRGALIERTAAGLSLPDACQAVQIREATVKGWLTRGRQEPEGEYAEFVAAIDAAREDAQSRPEPMDEAELLAVMSGLARRGSVNAGKVVLAILRRRSGDDSIDRRVAQAEDELALRRAAR